MSYRYAVTGATGWLGRAAVAILRARGEDVVAFASTTHREVRALTELPEIEHDVLLHFAYVTRDHLSGTTIDQYIASNAVITSTIREAIVRHRPAVFYASSGAAERPGSMREDPYGALKRLDEHILRDASGGRCAVARVFSVGGPHVTKPSLFLLTDLVAQALAGGPLRLNSNRRVVRSYVDVDDLAQWAVAAAGQDVVASTAGDREVEAGELAKVVLDVMGLDLPVKRPAVDPTFPEDRYVGDRLVWRRALQEAGVEERSLEEQVQRTASAMTPRLV